MSSCAHTIGPRYLKATTCMNSGLYEIYDTSLYLESNWGERERALVIVIVDPTYVHRYCACAALRANVAGRIGNRVSPAESAFSACIGSGSSQTS